MAKKKVREQGIAASRARPSLFERMGDELTLPLALKIWLKSTSTYFVNKGKEKDRSP